MCGLLCGARAFCWEIMVWSSSTGCWTIKNSNWNVTRWEEEEAGNRQAGRQAFVRLIIHTLLQMLLLLLMLLLIIIHIPSDVLLFRAARGFSPWMRVEGRKWRRGTAWDVRKGILCTEALANTFLGHYTPPPLLSYVATATAGWLSEQVLVLLPLLLWYTWTELKNTRSEFVP